MRTGSLVADRTACLRDADIVQHAIRQVSAIWCASNIDVDSRHLFGLGMSAPSRV